MDTIHEYRVAFKKTRSYLRLQGGNFPKGWDLLKEIYRQFGTIRNIETTALIAQGLGKSGMNKNQQFLLFLSREKNKAIGHAKDFLGHHGEKIAELRRQERFESDFSIPQSEFHRKLAKLWHKAKREYRKKEPDWHQLRKYVKDLGYWLDLYGKEEKRLGQLKKMGTQLGDWQDLQTFKIYWKAFRKKAGFDEKHGGIREEIKKRQKAELLKFKRLGDKILKSK